MSIRETCLTALPVDELGDLFQFVRVVWITANNRGVRIRALGVMDRIEQLIGPQADRICDAARRVP